MAFTFGFYDSMGGDRTYNAEQVSAIFDGLISDGVYASYGNIFAVAPGQNSMQVTVDTGRAWFNHTWNLNDSKMVLTLDAADVTLPRFDAIVIEVNDDVQSRTNAIKVVKGTTGSNPVKPAMENTANLHQHPLAYIRVPAGATSITNANIESVVGLSECPFVTGIIQTATLDSLFLKWEGDFDAWFNDLQAQLSGNIASNLQNQINSLSNTKLNESVFTAFQTSITADVNAKAQQSDLTALQNAVNTGQKNWWVRTGSYIGSGLRGASSPNQVSFETHFQPWFMAVMGGEIMVLGRNCNGAYILHNGTSNKISAEWLQNGVKWYTSRSDDSPAAQMNSSNTTYYYVAVGIYI